MIHILYAHSKHALYTHHVKNHKYAFFALMAKLFYMTKLIITCQVVKKLMVINFNSDLRIYSILGLNKEF